MGKRNQKGGKGPLPHLRSRTTRSSRGRLIPLQPSPSLPDQLRLLGLYAAPTLGDGNCLFRSLADQVYGSPVRHAEVRREVCDWIEKWGERYEGFVEFEGESGEEGGGGKRRKGKDKEGPKADVREGKSRRLESYLRNMRENGTYGGHMELSAFAHMTRRNIKVVQPGLVYVIEWRAGSGSSVSSSSTSNSNASASPSAPPSTTATSTHTSKSLSSTSTSTSTSSTAPRVPSILPDGRRLTRSTSGGAITDKFDQIQKKNRAVVEKALAVSAAKAAKDAKDAQKDALKVQKVKTGRHGYYVLEEVSSDEDEDGGVGEVGREEQEDHVHGEGGEKDGEQVQEPESKQERAEVVVNVKEEAVEEQQLIDAEAGADVELQDTVMPQQQQEEAEEDGGPTIYVAYHDWEHFSSIRNLRGPHSGLPNIQETPAYDYADDASPSAPASSASASAPPSKGLSEKEALKEREREKKKERERKEKEREKERREKGKGALKVKLKLASAPVSTASASPSAATSKPASTSSTPAPANVPTPALMSADPTLVPLLTSRSASPFTTVPGFGSAFGYGAGYASSPLTSLPSSASIGSVDSESQDQSLPQPQSQPQPSVPPQPQSEPYPSQPQPQSSNANANTLIQPSQLLPSPPLAYHLDEQAHAHAIHAHLQVAPRTQHRSPKRSFDESSASGGDGEESEKRSRRRVGSSGVSVTVGADQAQGAKEDVDMDMDVDADIDIDVEGEGTGTPALSAPGTSSSSSSESSSEVASELSSPPASVSPSPPPDIDAVISGTASMPLLPPSALEPSSIKSPLSHHGAKLKPKNRYQHPEKGLTRRQRKALGLPKARPGMHVNASGVHAGAGGAAGLSAGKIVIPGGRWTGREASAPAVAGGGGAGPGAEAEEEWRRNGTGRLDVRGFRELKI